MSDKQTISAAQLILMTIGSALMYPYTILPVLSAPPANQDVWISMIFAVVYIMLLSIPVLILMNKFRGLNVNQTVEMISGKIFGKFFIFMFSAFFLFCFVACMLLMIIFIRIYVLQKTPEWAILLLMGVPIIYGAYKGAGVIGKISLFITPIMLFSATLFFFLAIPDMKLDTIMPILADSKILDINLGAFLTAARYSDILIYFVFSYYLVKKASINKSFFTGITIFGITFFMILFPTLLILGPAIAKNEWNPYFVFTRQLETYDFLRRMQSLNVLVWLPGAILKLMIYIYMIGFLMENVFKTKNHRPFMFGSAILGFLIIISGVMNKTSIIEYLKSDALFPYIVFVIAFVLPMMLLIIYIIRKKKIDKMLEKKKKEIEKEQNDDEQNIGSEENSGNESNNESNEKKRYNEKEIKDYVIENKKNNSDEKDKSMQNKQAKDSV